MEHKFTYIILCKHREAKECSQVGQFLDLSTTARAQRFQTPKWQGGNLQGKSQTNVLCKESSAGGGIYNEENVSTEPKQVSIMM